mgnify:CR=1 FL=1
MKITKTQLKQIINEEMQNVMQEQLLLEKLKFDMATKYGQAVVSTAPKDAVEHLNSSAKNYARMLAQVIMDPDNAEGILAKRFARKAEADDYSAKMFRKLANHLYKFDVSKLFDNQGFVKAIGRKAGLNLIEKELKRNHNKVATAFTSISRGGGRAAMARLDKINRERERSDPNVRYALDAIKLAKMKVGDLVSQGHEDGRVKQSTAEKITKAYLDAPNGLAGNRPKDFDFSGVRSAVERLLYKGK